MMLAGYNSGSDSEENGSAEPTVVVGAAPASSSTSAPPKRRKVDYNTLIKGVANPLNLKLAALEVDDSTPILPSSRPGILSSLPPPRKARSMCLEVAPVTFPANAPTSNVSDDEADSSEDPLFDKPMDSAASVTTFFNFGTKDDLEASDDPPIVSTDSAPLESQDSVNTPFASGSANCREPVSETVAASSYASDDLPMLTGLTAKERQELRDAANTSSIADVRAENLNDPLWYIRCAGKKTTVTGVMKDVFDGQTNKVGEATGTQKRKHQINWLAADYHAHGAEILEKNATSRGEQGQTARRYGW